MNYELNPRQCARLANHCFDLAQNLKTLAHQLTSSFTNSQVLAVLAYHDQFAFCQYQSDVTGRYGSRSNNITILSPTIEQFYEESLQIIRHLETHILAMPEENATKERNEGQLRREFRNLCPELLE